MSSKATHRSTKLMCKYIIVQINSNKLKERLTYSITSYLVAVKRKLIWLTAKVYMGINDTNFIKKCENRIAGLPKALQRDRNLNLTLYFDLMMCKSDWNWRLRFPILRFTWTKMFSFVYFFWLLYFNILHAALIIFEVTVQYFLIYNYYN